MFPGIEFMGENVKKMLKKCGVNVVIRPLAKIVNPQMVEIGDNSIIDDYVLINGGKGVKIGKFVHISSFCSVIGGGSLELKDFSGISAGCRIVTGSDDFSGENLTNPSIPMKYKPKLTTGHITIGRHVIIGTNTVILPDTEVGDYSATAANTMITKSLESESIFAGSPVARRIKARPKEKLLEQEMLFLKDMAEQASR